MSTKYVEIARGAFQKTLDGKPVDLYTLSNSSGMVVKLTNQGGKSSNCWCRIGTTFWATSCSDTRPSSAT